MNILITTALNPILDAVAACYAYWRMRMSFNEQVGVGIEGKEDAPARWLLKELSITDIVRLETVSDLNRFDAYILWDTAGGGVLRNLPPIILAHRVIEIIDCTTHGSDYSKFTKAQIRIEPVTLSTVATEAYQARALPIDPVSTQLLYCAIYVTTNNLDPQRTTARDRAALRYLQTQMDVPISLVRDLFVATQPR